MKRITAFAVLISIICLTAFFSYAEDSNAEKIVISISNRAVEDGYIAVVRVSSDFSCGGIQGTVIYDSEKLLYSDCLIGADVEKFNVPEKSMSENENELTFFLLGDVKNGIVGNWIEFYFKSDSEVTADCFSTRNIKGVTLNGDTAVTEKSNIVTYGDANSDNFIDIRDLICIKKNIAKGENAKNNLPSDCDANGTLDSGDLVLLRKFLLNSIEVTLGVNETERRIINVSEYGAVGDGITDDGDSINSALETAKALKSGSKVVFDSNKTYFVSDTGNDNNTALLLKNLNGITVKGKNTTILCDKGLSYMQMSGCCETRVEGIDFDLKLRSHFVGTVTAVNSQEGYFDVISDRDFGYYGSWYPTNSPFCLVSSKHTSRQFITIKKFNTLNKNKLSYRIYADMSNYVLGTDSHVRALKSGDQVIIPVPNVGHCGERMFTVTNNNNITLKNINVWNSREFVFGLWWNEGEVVFDMVNVMPPENENVIFSSWRDVWHCKSNSAKLIWKNCTAKGNGDDIINISANMLYVENVVSNNEVICHWKETNGSYGPVKPGEKVVIWNVDTGKLIGKTTLKKVVDENNNHYVLNDEIDGLTSGENVRLCFETHAAPNSRIINCDFDGTLRFHGGPLTVTDSKLTLAKLWIDYETYLEGPIPHDILFKNCDFVLESTVAIAISAKSPNSIWKIGDYRLENIRFEDCSGLAKRFFEHKSNFEQDSPDYVYFSPEIPE